jgi:hypothetical protein
MNQATAPPDPTISPHTQRRLDDEAAARRAAAAKPAGVSKKKLAAKPAKKGKGGKKWVDLIWFELSWSYRAC